MAQIVAYAEKRRVKLAVETHLNMLTDTMAGTRRILDLCRSPSLGLTLDFCNIMVGRDDPEKAADAFLLLDKTPQKCLKIALLPNQKRTASRRDALQL